MKGYVRRIKRIVWNTLEKKILEADLIVLLSPVYLNNVSGAMKTFLDRIGSWVHTLRKRA